MLRIVIVPVVLALAVGGCSNKDQEITSNAITPAPTTAEGVKDIASNTGNAGKDAAQDATRTAKETAAETKDTGSKSGQKGKQGTQQTKDMHSAVASNWSEFLTTVKKCDALRGAENTQCMTDAGATYRAWNFNCETMAPQDREQCRTYSDRWSSASSASPQASTPAVRSGDPNVIPANPGDTSDKERNRDSTKQQAAAPQLQKQN